MKLVAVAVIGLAVLFAEPAEARSLTFTGKDGWGVTVDMTSTTGQTWDVGISTAEPPYQKGGMTCNGGVTGKVSFTKSSKGMSKAAVYSGELTVRDELYDPSAPASVWNPKACVIKLTIVGADISTAEDGCMSFHGANCTFDADHLPLKPQH